LKGAYIVKRHTVLPLHYHCTTIALPLHVPLCSARIPLQLRSIFRH